VLPDRVAAVLEGHPDVGGAVVLGVADDRLGAVPVALVEPRPGTSADPGPILDRARATLAGYEVPAELHVTPELPRTISGKVDLRAAEALLGRIRA
jgi:acyl-CoA synthetase (AMP-forming)/AMP-acid ligase II